jgi:hypothetical protein
MGSGSSQVKAFPAFSPSHRKEGPNKVAKRSLRQMSPILTRIHVRRSQVPFSSTSAPLMLILGAFAMWHRSPQPD